VTRLLVVAAIALLSTTVRVAENWNPELAAKYLDGRQQQWAAWPRAQSANGPCVSCHTGMTYLIARPALARILGEGESTKYERDLLARLRTNVGAKPAAALRDVEVIFAALFLTEQDAANDVLSPDAEKAFAQLWSLQLQDGDAAGGFKWYDASLDPWETPDSPYFGASLAALAVGRAPAAYRNRPDIRANIDRLTGYLTRASGTQPLHSRLALLWASSRLPEVLTKSAQQALVEEIFKAQASDGGWTLQSLGPWRIHKSAPAQSSSYATAFTAFVLQQAGNPSSELRLRRALDWLRARQEASGSWPAESMNKVYPDGSMEQSFMRDAATAFAAAALAGAS
jgi:squalene-hopene/tetraprenyl-beta-curcumene cyclase